MDEYGWIRINGIYYVYDRIMSYIPSSCNTDYFSTRSKKMIEKFVIRLNSQH